MQHSRIPRWVEFSVKNGTHFIVDRLEGRSFTVNDPALWSFAQKLDGKNPKMIEGSDEVDVDSTLCELEENGLLRTGRILDRSFGSVYITLFELKHTRAHNLVPFFMDVIREALWFPLLVTGWYYFWTTPSALTGGSMEWGMVLGYLSGILLHELSHAVSVLRWGGYCFEIGFCISHFVLPGAYALIGTDRIRKRVHKALVSFAGGESNFMLSGLFALLAGKCELFGDTFLSAAILNLLLGLINMLPGTGIDGEHVLSHLLGTVNAPEKAVMFLFYGWNMGVARYSGIFRFVAHFVAITLLSTKSIMPVLIVYQITELISLCS